MFETISFLIGRIFEPLFHILFLDKFGNKISGKWYSVHFVINSIIKSCPPYTQPLKLITFGSAWKYPVTTFIDFTWSSNG